MRRLVYFFSILLITLVSCQLQKVVVDVYSPAGLLLPPEMRSVLVTSRYVPATGPYEDIQWGAYESVDSLKWALSESMVDTIARRLVMDDKFLVKARHLPRMLRHNEPTMPEPLPWEGLASYAKKEYVQAVLLIEGFDIERTPDRITGSDGSYEARFEVGVAAAIRLYEPEKMRMVDDSVYRFITEFKGAGKTRDEALGKLPDDKQALFLATSMAAESYAKLIIPVEVKAERTYFNDRDSSMTVASQALKDGKWGRAESKWKWLAYNSPDSTIQAKASYNMALLCERDGRLNQALGFARRSQRIKPDKHTAAYIQVLEQKMLDMEEQVKQLKIIKRW